MALRGITGKPNTAASTQIVIDVSGLGIQDGDIVILAAVVDGSGTATITFPANFNTITGLTNVNLAGGTGTAGIKYKVASGEGTSYTIGSSTNDFHTGICLAYSGRNAAAPFSAIATLTGSSTANPNTNTQGFSLTGLTALAGDDVVAVIPWRSMPHATVTFTFPTPPASFTNATVITNTTQWVPAIAACNLINSGGGGANPLTGSCSSTTGGDPGTYCGYVFSLAAGVTAAPTAIIGDSGRRGILGPRSFFGRMI